MNSNPKRFDPESGHWSWEANLGHSEFIVAGDSSGPDARRMPTLERLVPALGSARQKAVNLLHELVKAKGELDLYYVELAEGADKLECDFVMRFIDYPADDPQRYDTYFDVCFRDTPDHPSEFYRFHPFKFVVGFF